MAMVRLARPAARPGQGSGLGKSAADDLAAKEGEKEVLREARIEVQRRTARVFSPEPLRKHERRWLHGGGQGRSVGCTAT